MRVMSISMETFMEREPLELLLFSTSSLNFKCDLVSFCICVNT